MSTPWTALETVLLRDPDADSVVAIAPARGGIVTRFVVAGRSVLYLDEATLLDPAKNIRGGVPVLFPSPGALTGERFRYADVEGRLKQHGFARQLPWRVAAQSAGSVTLALESDDETRPQYPWDFALTMDYALRGARLRVTQRIENRSTSPMPFALGFHPYFHVPDGEKSRASIVTAARHAFDNAAKATVGLEGPIDLTRAEVDLHLDEHATLALADGSRIIVMASAEYRRWVIWTLAGRDFVCLEPWTAPGDALNTGEGLLAIAPGATRELWTEIALVGA